MINQFLAELSTETRTLLYNSTGYIRWIAVLLCLIFLARREGLNKKGIVQLFVAYYGSCFAGNAICRALADMTGGIVLQFNLGIAFLTFLPVAVLVLWFLRAPVLQFFDMMVPVYILGRGVVIVGCLFPGCCHGAPVAWGIYSYIAQRTVVPTVLIDMAFSYIIVAYLLLTGKKDSAPGAVAAKGILFFGVLRYVIDVLRDNNKLFGMITVEGICGILYVLTGLILLYLIDNKKTQESSVEAETCTN